ncbi:CRISPR-associated protein Csx18 [Phormidium sp. CCY1219]|uniref:CRISPR-associated protein Csx18 n=1 Tax=Phormidium sp. CCY1219 TaxID=2886104 RepID=UPI002D1EB957|nr:CRISPR-associated protein Csx18 [Phormidium sp. CCY1219]MEB3830333.1 CRISPR-associated protein Csx18 [Phormidium sp. CCY1219]
MYLTHRAATVRNFSVALVNGSVTLVILLIAPLGLASVIANTFLVTAASFFTATFADSVVRYLQPSRVQGMNASVESPLDTRNLDDIDRR